MHDSLEFAVPNVFRTLSHIGICQLKHSRNTHKTFIF